MRGEATEERGEATEYCTRDMEVGSFRLDPSSWLDGTRVVLLLLFKTFNWLARRPMTMPNGGDMPKLREKSQPTKMSLHLPIQSATFACLIRPSTFFRAEGNLDKSGLRRHAGDGFDMVAPFSKPNIDLAKFQRFPFVHPLDFASHCSLARSALI